MVFYCCDKISRSDIVQCNQGRRKVQRLLKASAEGDGLTENDSNNCDNGVALAEEKGETLKAVMYTLISTQLKVVLRQRRWTKTSRRCDNHDQAVRNKRAALSAAIAHLTADSHRDCDISLNHQTMGRSLYQNKRINNTNRIRVNFPALGKDRRTAEFNDEKYKK